MAVDPSDPSGVTPTQRRRRAFLFVVLATVLTVFGSVLPAVADPGPDSQGSTKALSDQLEASARSYYDIKAKLVASQQRQTVIKKNLASAQLSLVRLQAVVGNIAAARYEGAQLDVLNAIVLDSNSPNDLLQGGAIAEYLVWKDDEQLRQLREAQDSATSAQQQLDTEVANEKAQYAALDAAKRKAEKALASAGGLVGPAGYTGNAVDAQPAPRNPDGSFPNEGCSITDPTGTGGCITPRMFHVLTEARLAGFTHYTACWRQATWGEHPLGRACDFAADPNGFGGVAVGASKTYGTNLANWALHNADALGIIYVIWYRQIWMPGVGWSAYFGVGSPSDEHTNHVHISVL
jgi:hypothetical protein